MNITTDELLNELRNGKSAEDLANQLIENLNEANIKYQEEQKAAREASASLAEKNNDLITTITDNLNEYFKNNNCDSLVFTEDEVASILQGAVQLTNLFSTLMTKKDNAATAVKNKITDIDEVIANWIDELN